MVGPIFILAFLVSAPIWYVGWYFEKNRILSFTYWILSMSMLAILILVPSGFSDS